jgi:undecaprenyl-diphosphatase
MVLRRDRVHISDPVGSSKPKWLSRESWLGWLVILGSIPIGVFGILFKDVIEGDATKNLWLISTMLIVIALLLLLAEKVGSHRKEMKDLGVSDAAIVGFAQVLALIPGASRSGSTIMGGLFAGETRETAARFSFLLSIPAIAASGLLELREAAHILPQASFLPLIVGTVTAGIVGYVSIWFLLAYLRKNSTMVFIVYRLVLASVIITLLLQGVIDP